MTLILLSTLHIVLGAFWAGSALLLALFIDPAVEAAGPAGGAFMQKLIAETRFAQVMPFAGMLTVLSGLLLYWLASGFAPAWITSPHGIAITIGGVAGILAAVVGAVLVKRPRLRMVALMRALPSGQVPNPEQQAEIGRLKAAARRGSLIGSVLILAALAGMALAKAL